MAVLAAAALTIGLTACSGGVGGSSSDDKSGGASEAASTEPIKLGMLAPFSGSESAFGPYMKTGATLAVDEINA
jgi:branched-chain amino acid transport system substrate-binding protein